MTDRIANLRNIAIIAHVDHGKTTLVDKLLRQSGTLKEFGEVQECVMDSNELERERGITILAKNTAVRWNDLRINIVDTPGHADFGGEVERVLSMVDSVLLLVDAIDGPMPQTRFVTRKALARGLKPIVVVNKLDRPNARPEWVVDQTFDLFDRLGATDEQMDFPIVFTSATEGWASLRSDERGTDMTALFEMIVASVPPPDVDLAGPFQMQVSALDYSSYVGVIGIGRIKRGRVERNSDVAVIGADGAVRTGRVLQIMGFNGLERIEWPAAEAGQIVAFTGLDEIHISDTLCHPDAVEPLPALIVDEPTITMSFLVNNSPFAGREGRFVTSRNLGERLAEEVLHNVALRVEPTDDPNCFQVSGRGELHLAILVETMRREGYEFAISRPEVILKTVAGEVREPWETLTLDIEIAHQGAVMELVGERRGEVRDVTPDNQDRVRLDGVIPSRGLIGFQSQFMTVTSGTGLVYHTFDQYGPRVPGALAARQNGALVSMADGKAVAYALFNLQDRGELFVGHGAMVYEGMIVGINSRPQDLAVNPMKGRQLTNIRAAANDENIILTPPVPLTLEFALGLINDDELVEVTPQSIRVRKKLLLEHQRKKASRVA